VERSPFNVGIISMSYLDGISDECFLTDLHCIFPKIGSQLNSIGLLCESAL